MESTVLSRLLAEVEVLARRAAEASPAERSELLTRLSALALTAESLAEVLGRADALLTDIETVSPVVARETESIQPVETLAPSAPKEPSPQRQEESTVEDQTQSEAATLEQPQNGKLVPRKPFPTPASKRDFRKRLTELTKETDQLQPDSNPSKFAVRALVALARGVLEQGRELECDIEEAHDEWKRIQSLFKKIDGGEFFGMNRKRGHHSKLWLEVEHAYRALVHASEALPYFEAMKGELEEVPEEIVQGLACSCALLGHVNAERGLGVADKDAQSLIDKLKGLWPNMLMPALQINSSDAMPLDRVEAAAKKFPAAYKSFVLSRETKRKRASATEALEALVQLIHEAPNPENFVSDLISAVEACIESGVPPTKKELVSPLLPYKAFFDHVESKSMAKFKQEMEKQLTLHLKRGSPNEAPDPVEMDVDLMNRLKDLRPLLRDKVLLLVGGNKRQEKRIVELKKNLGLKDVIWPDLEEPSKFTGVFPDVDKADIVAQLIRWSRHSYSEVLDYAKKQGKPVARIAGGLGVNRIAFDLHSQVLNQLKALA